MLELDGTPNKAKLGANAILGVSMAVARAARDGVETAALSLPRRADGAHAAGADDEHPQRRRARRQHVDFQEFMVVPVGAETFAEALRWAPRSSTRSRRCSSRQARDGRRRRRRLRARLKIDEEALHVILEAIEAAGYKPGKRDRARPRRAPRRELSQGREVHVQEERRRQRATRRAWSSSTRSGCEKYPIVSIEDGWPRTTGTAGRQLTEGVRRPRAARRRRSLRHQHRAPRARHRERHRQRDPDQGEPDRHADRDARGHRAGARGRLPVVISHRQGETEDTFIADLAVATNAGQIKTGARRAPIASRSTTSCFASRNSSVSSAEFPGRRDLRL